MTMSYGARLVGQRHAVARCISQELDVMGQALPIPPVARMMVFALKTTKRRVSRQ